MSDLNKERDERCIPVAKVLLGEISHDLTTESGPKTLALKSLSIMLEKDLNIVTDVPYIPQLILKALSGLNSAINTCILEPIDTEKYTRITNEILVILAESDVKIGDITPMEEMKEFIPVKEKIQEIVSREKLNEFEVKHIMDNIFNYFQAMEKMLMTSIETSSKKAEAKLFELDDLDDLTMKKLNDVLLK